MLPSQTWETEGWAGAPRIVGFVLLLRQSSSWRAAHLSQIVLTPAMKLLIVRLCRVGTCKCVPFIAQRSWTAVEAVRVTLRPPQPPGCRGVLGQTQPEYQEVARQSNDYDVVNTFQRTVSKLFILFSQLLGFYSACFPLTASGASSLQHFIAEAPPRLCMVPSARPSSVVGLTPALNLRLAFQ